MSAMREVERIETTLGDLIVALSDAAFELCDDKRATYLLASIALEEIVKNAHLRATGTAETLVEHFPKGSRLH